MTYDPDRDARAPSDVSPNERPYSRQGAGLSTAGSGGPSIYGSTSGNAVGHAYVQIPRSPPLGGGSGASTGFAHNYEYRFRMIMGELVTAWRARKLSNFDYLMGCDVHVTDPRVSEELDRWGRWYVERLD